ncbi:MAG: SpoIVB peptidase [Firmicutes bacterium]|nr:SpoIVB peptidase [Bacillota bacterium]
MKKLSKKLLLLLPVFAFLTAYITIPAKMTVVQGDKLDFSWGMTAGASTEDTGEFSCTVKLFNCIPIKSVDVSVTPKCYVIPSGESIGVKLHTDGVMVVGLGEVQSGNGAAKEPAKDAGICVGDRIVDVNGQSVMNASAFARALNEAKGSARIGLMRGDSRIEVNLHAVYSKESYGYKAGIWVRDSTAGIGTLTFYNPENSTFAALGHGICDSDTKEIMTVGAGSVNLCRIINVRKGEHGNPGELMGNFSDTVIGEIKTNSLIGIYGTAEIVPQKESVAVASRFQIKEGNAFVLCDVDGNGAKTYEIEITKISKSAQINNKSFVIKVTDPVLIEKTGGIVQGMSGAPIIQNGMLAGAVTHVFVNDPKRGYGIFAENMLDVTMQMK